MGGKSCVVRRTTGTRSRVDVASCASSSPATTELVARLWSAALAFEAEVSLPPNVFSDFLPAGPLSVSLSLSLRVSLPQFHSSFAFLEG